MKLAEFAEAVARYRDATGASVHHWGCTHLENQRLGREKTSLHLVDLAVDVTYDRILSLPTARELAQVCGLLLRREPHHDHLQPLTLGGPSHASR